MDVLGHVAMLGEHDVFAPVAAVDQAIVAIAVHPAVVVVMVAEREMFAGVAERLAQGDALAVERVGDATDGRLGALVVDVPALEVLQRAGVHQDQRRMDDRSRVHQCAGQRILDRFDRRKGSAQHGKSLRRLAGREHSGWQPRGAHGDGDFGRAVLARQPRQRSGLGEGDVSLASGVAQRAHHGDAAEGPGRQEDHLAVSQMRRRRARDVLLGEGWRRYQDQFGPAQRSAEIGRD